MNIINVLLLLIAAETTYLTVRQLRSGVSKIQPQSILLDTSVLIDGRIESIARSGLVTAPLVVPRSVVRELQYMADKADHDKRERARYGLDMIEKLQAIDGLTVRVLEDDPLTDGGVDERLVTLAKSSDARLCTTDYNLNKAARVQGVTVLNINEIAHALRIVRLPGEKVGILLQQPGQERDQAVGYLDDGTMVVVDNGKSHIGEVVDVEITRALQTVAGKMMFAKLISTQQFPAQKKNYSGKTLNKKSSLPAASEVSTAADSDLRVQSVTSPSVKKTDKRAEAHSDNRETHTDARTAGSSRKKPDAAQRPPKVDPTAQAPKRRRKSMTDRAEDSLVDLLNKQ